MGDTKKIKYIIIKYNNDIIIPHFFVFYKKTMI